MWEKVQKQKTMTVAKINYDIYFKSKIFKALLDHKTAIKVENI